MWNIPEVRQYHILDGIVTQHSGREEFKFRKINYFGTLGQVDREIEKFIMENVYSHVYEKLRLFIYIKNTQVSPGDGFRSKVLVLRVLARGRLADHGSDV